MNDFLSLIENSRKIKKESIASTIRMPESLHTFIETLASDLELSKQEIMLKLLEQGAKAAQEALAEVEKKELAHLAVTEKNEPHVTAGFHILNTNKAHSDEDSEWMATKGIAAAFYDPWKWNINRIEANDVVFLYENGKGIVAYGRGAGEVKVCDYNGDKDQCHYQELEGFKVLEKPISAAEIKKILERNVVFLRTMSTMSDGQKVLNFIEG
ncbi:hypothetical protein [Pectobacterium carotovorum]|uniref:Uncharacterized protein n=1 Tax=Pectobacterium carotovorum subsp. carotovorum TaxID=555 RepID=A0AAI9PDL1_PECCC|nr:hypothetical protein [Pectobacterium carotovorum]KHT26701.1 hypothetical protein RC98_13420 [Pectobacterium carotovorum subsp. carotovorum]GKV90430.1 hypothetical protein PEC301619_24120 [Pectobacterium carotovorum subsp. carotovorum]GKW03155.1 hypothetical protein PEC301877_19700 [Pectobacterium carotovorum subsp. carotovorum]GKX46661.1 hypothetical protein SOASR016_14130 [Pectobacterium carotovorum subsp. carotovorum]GLV68568.1 hypothetical protein Pcaca03_10120 [Pectobacterium carotovoru